MLKGRLSITLVLLSAVLTAPGLAAAQTLEQALATIALARPQSTAPARSSIAPEELLARLQQDGESVLVLEKTHRQLAGTGDPIWDLRLEIPGHPVRHYDALSGRANRQDADRDQMGSRAPLPAGHYTLGPVEPLAAGAYPELGPIWISIEPTFTTGRRVLGIHQDPSAGRNGNSGTLGCIGLIDRNDLLDLAQQVKRAKIRELVVTH